MPSKFINRKINMAAEKPNRVVKKPKRFAEEFSRSITVKNTEARNRDKKKKLYNVEVTEVDKVNKRIKIRFVGYSTQFEEWRFFGGDDRPDLRHLLSNTISRTEFVSNISKIHTKIKEISRSFQF